MYYATSLWASSGQAAAVADTGAGRGVKPRYHRFHFGGCILLAILLGSMFR